MTDSNAEIARLTEALDALRIERDRLRSQLRRAEAQTLPALFLLLGDAQPLDLFAEEREAIRAAIDEAEEPVALPCPACCMVTATREIDGTHVFVGMVPSMGALFRLAERLRMDYQGQPVTFWLRAPREATPTAEAVEAAIMCRRVGA